MKKKLFKPVLTFGLAVAVAFGGLATGITASGTAEAADLSTAKVTTTSSLAQVTGLKYDSNQDIIYWNKVAGADYYYITMTDSKGTTYTTSTSSLYKDVSGYHSTSASTYTVTVYAKSYDLYLVASNVSWADRSKYTYDTYTYDATTQTYTLYKYPVGPKSATLKFTLSGEKAASTTAVSSAPTIVKKEVYGNYVYFTVKGEKLNLSYNDEYLQWQYSNNATFKKTNDGKNWVYTSSASSSSTNPTLSVYLGDKGYGETIYVRARVYNPNYKEIVQGNGYSYYSYGKWSSFSNVVSYKVPKSEVTSVNTYVTGTTITLSAASNGAATGYQFAKKVGSSWVVLAKQTDNTYKDTGLTKNAKYNYRVRSYFYNAATKKTTYSAWTKVEATTWAANLNFQAAAASTTSTKLTWNKVSGATGYEIYRSDTTGSSLTKKKGQANSSYTDYVLVKTLSAKKTSYTDKKLTAGRTYNYQIRAYKTINKQKVYISDSYSITLDAHSLYFSNQYVNASGKTVVTWNKITGIKGYYLEKYDEVNGTWTKVKTLKATKTSYTFPKVNVGSNSVQYRIRPYDANKIYSGSTVTINPTLAKVTGVTAKKTTKGIKVTWKAVAGADYYMVFRSTSSKAVYDSTTKTYSLPSSYELVYEGNVDTTNCDYGYNYTTSYYTSKIEGLSVVDQALTYQERTQVWDDATQSYKYADPVTDASGNTTYPTDVAYYGGVEGPQSGVTYYYYVVAYAKASNGSLNYSTISSVGASKPVSATYTAKKATKPKKVTVSSKTKATATIKIKKVKGATGYAIYRATKKNGTYVLVGLSTKTTFTDKSVTAGKTYYYKVSSYVLSEAKVNIYSAKTKAYKLTIKK